jgi:dolichol-phosphate mannosyltransferase
LVKDLLSIVIPAYNEEENIEPTLSEIIAVLNAKSIPHEIVVVNDNSKDKTPDVVRKMQITHKQIKLVNRTPPGGFGRAIRTGLENFSGEYVVIVMADLSDDPEDIAKYYYKLKEGYDCVFGSRFQKESKVIDYPIVKLYINRIVNKMIQLLFWTGHNDLTNAFKGYRYDGL